MSRCFPYPPPGYTRSGIRDEVLIESIKLQREVEGEKAQEERKKEKKRGKVRLSGEDESKREKEERKKEKKREKEERNKERKREKVRGNGEVKGKRHRHEKRHRNERGHEDQKCGNFEKKQKYDDEHYEKSSLTEEHGNPAGSQNSSDNTLNSKMTRKQDSPSSDRHNSGNIIRIRLPLQRRKDSEVVPTKGQPFSAMALGMSKSTFFDRTSKHAPILGRETISHPCSTSHSKYQEPHSPVSKDKSNLCHGASGSSILGAKLTSAQRMSEPSPVLDREVSKHLCSTSQSTDHELTLRVSKGNSTSRSSSLQAKSNLHAGLRCSCPPTVAPQFRDLVENWVPSILQSECLGSDCQSWLFGIKQEKSQNSKARKCEGGSAVSSYLNSTCWPLAHHLPEAEIYALPFTVPF